jgi:hypothetical protein
MTDIKRTMIASLLIEQATELKGKRPTELGFEDLVDVVQGVVKNCSIPVVSSSEVFEHYGKPFTSGRDLWDFLTAHYNFTPKT